jgi:GGDEF domain-containing protein
LRFTPVHAIKGQSLLREGDSVFRFAGDEFVVLLPNQNLASATRVERSGPAVTCG